MSLPTPLPPEGEAMVSGPPPKGLRYQAHSTLSPRRLNSGPGPHCTKAATPRGPARLARRAPPRAPACGLAREGGVDGKGAASPGRSARRPRGAHRAPHLPVAPATCPSRPQPDHSRPTLTAPAPPQPAKALASSRLLRPAAARASGRRALAERDQSRRTAAAHWGSRERAKEAANRRREARAAQLRGAMEAAWAGPVAGLARLTAVAPGGAELWPRGEPGERRVEAAGSWRARECEERWELVCEPASVELKSHF